MIDKNTEVFLPIKLSAYKQSKINTLKTQMKTVKTIERINRLKEIRKIKSEQRKLLKKALSDLTHL
jgi:hypothetical protein